MIELFYNLKTSIFSKEIHHDNIFVSESSKELSRRLNHIKDKRGIMLITGPPGVGKTLHIRAFHEKLNSNQYKTFYVALSTVSPLEFYRQLSFQLSGQISMRKANLFNCIQQSIKDMVLDHKKVPIIIFDEAHFLQSQNFHELQIISNFNMDSTDPCIFILVGQSHLQNKLLTPAYQSFNHRITLKFELFPFTKEETSLYINHQLNLAGVKEPIFSENAIEAIYGSSGGTARIINKLCINAMTIGAIDKKHSLTEEEIYRAESEL